MKGGGQRTLCPYPTLIGDKNKIFFGKAGHRTLCPYPTLVGEENKIFFGEAEP